MFQPKRTVTPIGLDMGTTSLRVVELKPTSGKPVLTRMGSVDVPPGVIVEGEIGDPALAASALTDLWKKTGLKHKQFTVGISNQKVIVRLVELPYMDEQELRGALQYQAQEYIAIPMEEAILDFQIVGEFTTADDEHMMEVLLVAAQKDMVQKFVDTIQQAGLEPEVIDVASFALLRSLAEPAPIILEEGKEAEAVVLMNISAGITNIVVVEEGIPRFSRVTSMAGDDFSRAVANALNLSFEEGEELKIKVGLPALGSEGEAAAVPKLVGVAAGSSGWTSEGPADIGTYFAGEDPEKIGKAQQALVHETHRFIDEVRRSLDYYLTQAKVASIQNVVLTGGASQLTNLAGYLEKALQVNVSYGHPLTKVDVVPSLRERAEREESSMAICLGLALRGVEA
jgi:type IV pilus assembly protein PilM